MTAWKPIDSAPRDGTDILLACPYAMETADEVLMFVGGWSMGDDEWTDSYLRAVKFTPTHWQPLPEPPVAEGGE